MALDPSAQTLGIQQESDVPVQAADVAEVTDVATLAFNT